MKQKERIIQEITKNKWTKDFKHLCAHGLGYRLTGFTKAVALEAAETLRQNNMIERTYKIIVLKEDVRE